MEEEKRNVYTVVVIVILIGVLLSCIAGALAGGMAGFVAGRQQGQAVAERALEDQLGELSGSDRGWRHPAVPVVPAGVEGAFILEVVDGTPAAEAGLQTGDIIVAVDRTPVNAAHELPDVLDQYEPGDRVMVQFWRANQEKSVRVELAQNPDRPGLAYLGVYFEMVP